MIRLPRSFSSAAMRWLSRYGLGEQPTTAHVSGVDRRSRIVSSGAAAAMGRRIDLRPRGQRSRRGACAAT
jgi:hypothetical protein